MTPIRVRAGLVTVADSNRSPLSTGCLEDLGETEVQDLDRSVGQELDVGRLQITVNDSMLVSQVQRVRNLPRNLQRFFERNRAARDPIGECLPVDEFQHQGLCAIRLVHAVDARDVRVIERGEDFGFLLETCEPIVIGQKSFREYFQGDIAFEFRVACPVDLSHSADADQRHDFIGSETRTGPETHGCAAIVPVVSENCAGASIDSARDSVAHRLSA